MSIGLLVHGLSIEVRSFQAISGITKRVEQRVLFSEALLRRTVPKEMSEVRDLAQQSDIQNPNVYWKGNLSRSRSQKKHCADLEMVRGSLRSSI